MQPNDRENIFSSEKMILASRFINPISSKVKKSFISHFLPLESSKTDPRDYRLGAILNRGTGKIHDIVDPNLNCLENSWIATEFEIKNSKVTTNGDINNIDKKQYPELYDDIAIIFQEMLPCLKEVQNIEEFEKLNVIVKIQSYELKNNETYEGEFHQEGLKEEGILMVAIYYFNVSQNLKGGDLELRFPKKEKEGEFEIKRISIDENDVVIFRNQECEHRINKLETMYPKIDQIYERKILTFFIADPKKSKIPNSVNMTLNKELEKDIIYAKRDQFKKNRFHTNLFKEKEKKLESEENKSETFEIFISFDKTYSLQVSPAENIGSLKVKIEKETGVPKSIQNIYFNKNWIRYKFDNEAKLDSLPIAKGCTMRLYRFIIENNGGFQIFVKGLMGEVHTVVINDSDTILTLKKYIEFVTLIPTSQQRLLFAGKQLEESKTLYEYGIMKESTIHLILRLSGD